MRFPDSIKKENMRNLGTSNIRWEMRIVISMCLGYGMLMLCRTVVGVAEQVIKSSFRGTN